MDVEFPLFGRGNEWNISTFLFVNVITMFYDINPSHLFTEIYNAICT